MKQNQRWVYSFLLSFSLSCSRSLSSSFVCLQPEVGRSNEARMNHQSFFLIALSLLSSLSVVFCGSLGFLLLLSLFCSLALLSCVSSFPSFPSGSSASCASSSLRSSLSSFFFRPSFIVAVRCLLSSASLLSFFSSPCSLVVWSFLLLLLILGCFE